MSTSPAGPGGLRDVGTLTDVLLVPRSRDAQRSGSPLITWYSPSGARVELSATTALNWAAKIAHLLVDEASVRPGDSVRLGLSVHWLAPVIVAGTWWAGAQPVLAGEDLPSGIPEPLVAVLDARSLAAGADEGCDDVWVYGDDAMGRGMTEGPAAQDLPLGVGDLAPSARIHPDAFSPAPPTPAGRQRMTKALREAMARSTELGYTPGHVRILTSTPWTTSALLRDEFLLPLALDGTVVLADVVPRDPESGTNSGPDSGTAMTGAEDLDRIAAMEKVTHHVV